MAHDSVKTTGVPRIAYFGMSGRFSAIPLATLQAAGIPISAIFVPAAVESKREPGLKLAPAPDTVSELPLASRFLDRGVAQMGWEWQIPVYELADARGRHAVEHLSTFKVDLAVVACFSQRISRELLAIPRLGFMNLHPSLLPAYRGPVPLFWQFQMGERATGVTVHLMDAGLDTGDIVAQTPVALPAGTSGPEAERLMAAEGANLLLKVIKLLTKGKLQRRPQPPGGTYYPFPSTEDFLLSTRWSARRAFGFMRGTAEWNQPYEVQCESDQLRLRSALSFEPDRVLERPYVRQGSQVWIQFEPGVLEATLS